MIFYIWIVLHGVLAAMALGSGAVMMRRLGEGEILHGATVLFIRMSLLAEASGLCFFRQDRYAELWVSMIAIYVTAVAVILIRRKRPEKSWKKFLAVCMVCVFWLDLLCGLMHGVRVLLHADWRLMGLALAVMVVALAFVLRLFTDRMFPRAVRASVQ